MTAINTFDIALLKLGAREGGARGKKGCLKVATFVIISVAQIRCKDEVHCTDFVGLQSTVIASRGSPRSSSKAHQEDSKQRIVDARRPSTTHFTIAVTRIRVLL